MRNCLEFFGIFWGNFFDFNWTFFGGIFLEDVFGRILSGGFFWEDFLEEFFGRIFLGGFFWEEFFGRNSLVGFFWEDFFERIF